MEKTEVGAWTILPCSIYSLRQLVIVRGIFSVVAEGRVERVDLLEDGQLQDCVGCDEEGTINRDRWLEWKRRTTNLSRSKVGDDGHQTFLRRQGTPPGIESDDLSQLKEKICRVRLQREEP